jgi:hypothetical protein
MSWGGEMARERKAKSDEDSLRDLIRAIVREEIQAAMESRTLLTDRIELPPLPQKMAGPHGKPIGRGQRAKIAGTVDKELARRLEEWRRERGITLSRALDAALWLFLGQPPLSFESDKTEK